MDINFTYHSPKLRQLILNKKDIKSWIKYIVEKEFKKKINEINYYFTIDEEILDYNIKFLNHNYYTDIITFDYSVGKYLEADIVVSIDTVKYNAFINGDSFRQELLRVIIHGIFHILGYDDQTETQQMLIREKENWAIELYYQKWK